jgi:DNA-binding NtrC family response regulator
VPIVVITAYGSVETAVKALKFGAADFVTKPFDNEKLLDTVDALLVSRDEASKPSSSLVGESPRFLEVMELALRFARPDVNLLLLGETGTGKEVLARAIHAASKRNQKPLVTVDCSVLSESLLESELFGHEKGAFTGATGTRIGHFERAQGGHSLPRRDRQSAALHPGQAAAGPPGAHLLAGRRDRHNPPRRARDLGDERRFRRGHPSRHVP